jgi:hypothetical protein
MKNGKGVWFENFTLATNWADSSIRPVVWFTLDHWKFNIHYLLLLNGYRVTFGGEDVALKIVRGSP